MHASAITLRGANGYHRARVGALLEHLPDEEYLGRTELVDSTFTAYVVNDDLDSIVGRLVRWVPDGDADIVFRTRGVRLACWSATWATYRTGDRQALASALALVGGFVAVGETPTEVHVVYVPHDVDLDTLRFLTAETLGGHRPVEFTLLKAAVDEAEEVGA